jgi:mannose/cellobiose epimerase-like protein (N-acyl-D-glucosamine 2-epimerase family)
MADGIYAAVSRWLFEEALPFWATNGVDRTYGGYVEHLRLDGTNPDVDFKRTRVIGRQIYVFSHAALLGRSDGVALARHGYEFLTKHAWLGPKGGWARQLDRKGAVIDPTPDLYDLAFVLFALGWYYRASGDAEALRWAHRTLDFLHVEMRHPGALGFLSVKPETGPRLQNPHMHLLEAALVNLQASGDARFGSLANEIVALFCDHFFDPDTGTLGEYFNEDWSRMEGDGGRLVEPGHQFEWAWILAGYQQATGRDMQVHVRRLVDFTERHGVDASGATFDLVRDDGVVLDRGLRIWPNSERIQAAVAMFELDGQDPRPSFEQSGKLLLEHFLSHTPRGTWIDHFNADGTPRADKIPASTLYHLMIAFAEMLRVKDAVARAFP